MAAAAAAAVVVPDPDLRRLQSVWAQEQDRLREQLVTEDGFRIEDVRYIAGVDISFVKDTTTAFAGIVVQEFPALTVVYSRFERVELSVPYIPGFLAFREVPHLVRLLDELRDACPQFTPDVILVDGNGVLHSRGFGLACHLGVSAGIPTIGCAKNLHMVGGLNRDVVKLECRQRLRRKGDRLELRGPPLWSPARPPQPLQEEPGLRAGIPEPEVDGEGEPAQQDLAEAEPGVEDGGREGPEGLLSVDPGDSTSSARGDPAQADPQQKEPAANLEVYGAALLTADGIDNPVFVSVGHLVSLETALELVLRVSPRYRIPEPIRQADLQSREAVRRYLAN